MDEVELAEKALNNLKLTLTQSVEANAYIDKLRALAHERERDVERGDNLLVAEMNRLRE